MVPLESATVILPSMPTGRTITGEFPLTIMKPPVLEVKARASPSAVSSPVYRLLRSRNQRKNISASSVRSGCSTMSERKELMTETVEVFELKETDQYVVKQVQKTCTLPDNVHSCNENTAPSRQSILISSAKERHVCIQERPLELMPEQDGMDNDRHQLNCNSTDLIEESMKPNNFPAEETDLKSEDVPGMDSKQKEISPLEKVDKKTRGKSCRAKRTQKKGKISVKKGPRVTSIFARLVGSQVQKKQHGQINFSNELRKQRASNGHQARDTSPNKYLYIQKLRAAYAPKKNDNKNNTVLLPRVSNNTSIKDNAVNERNSPRKQDQELENVSIIVSPSTSSPRKLLNSDDDKVKKVFLSETHSGMIAGIPCAPPSTPSVDELKKVEYIPSLTDVKSQRAVKTRLVNLGNKIRAEEQRRKEKALKKEQKRAYGAVLQLKQRQRAEIYALNEVMTELENENFRKFMEENSAESLPV